MATFAKNRFCSHVKFISTCIRSNLIPNGFRIKWTPSFSHNNCTPMITANLNSCSKRLMRYTLSIYNRNVQEQNNKMQQYRENLQNHCSNEQLGRIRHILHDLNRSYYNCLVEVKSSKLNHLRQQQHQQAPSHVRNADSHKLVVTIPEDLPFTEDERSVLSNGLTYIPRKNNIYEFQAESDVEQFYCRLRLKTHFFDQNKILMKMNCRMNLQYHLPRFTPAGLHLRGNFTALDLYIYTEYFRNLRCAPIVVTLASATNWCTLHCLAT